MKNRSLIWALAALVLASCNTADVEKINFKDDHVLTASIENPTRTVVETGGTKVLWNAGEDISVFLNGTNYKFTSKNTSQAATANFEGTPSLSGVSDSNPIRAISPYKSDTKISGETVTFKLPASQQALAGSYDPTAHALAAYSTNTEVSFYNVTGGVRFTLKQSGITDITLKGNNSETLAGDIQVKVSGVSPQVTNVTSAVKEIKLVAPSGGFKTGVWYYITTIPVKFTKGFTIDFKQGDKAASFTTSQSAEVKRGLYGSISEIDRNLTFQDPTVHVESITVDPTSMKLAPSETGTITATVLPENATDKSIKWSSSNETVATVDQNGKVTAKAAGTTVIVALTNDGFKTATCNVTVAPPANDMRSQYAESSSGYQTFGKVIHYKYGTKYGSTENEFYVVPWGDGKAVEDTDASHFSATSSKTSTVSVNVVKVGNSCVFAVKVLRDPTSTGGAFSDLKFTYTPASGSSLSKTTRISVFPSSATNAFSYKYFTYYNQNGSLSRPDLNSNSTFTHVLSKANEENWLRIFISNTGSASQLYSVPDTKEMATYTFSTSNSSVVKLTEKIGVSSDGDNAPYAELNFKDVGTSNVVVKYVDYKGNTLNKTFKMTVKKSFLASGDYIKNTSNVYAPSSTSSGNRDYVGTSSVTTISLCKSNGTPYTEDELQDITWTSNNTSIATLYNTKNASTGVSGAGVGDFTITAKGKDGSTKTYYMTGYKPVSSITPNSTTYTLGLGTAHTMNYTDKDYTVNPSDATYKKSTYFKWQSLNTNVVTMNGDVVYGVGTGTTYVQAAPKPWYATWYNARQIKVVDYRLKVTGGTSRTAPSGTLYKNDDIITIEAGKEATVCFSTTGGTNITYTASFATATTHTSVATVAGNTSSATIKGVAAGTAYIDLDYTGDNGRILQRYQVKVVPTFTWASGDIASNSYNARPKTSPLFLKIGSTNNVYAYKGSGASATQYSSSVAGAVTWTSANTSIATVSPATGNMTTVTAKANGLVEIKGTDSNGSSRSCWVYCYTSVTSVSTKPTMCVGKNCTYSKTLTAGTDFTFSPSNANPYKWKYQSTNTNIATVTEDGVVSVYTGGNEGSATIQVQPYPDGSSIGFKNARTFKVVYWRMYASYSNCTSAGTVQQSDGTVSGGTMGFTSGATLKIDKGSQVNLKFYNVSEGHKLGDGTYTFTNSNSSVATITSTNSDPSNHGSYISVKGVKAGTTSVTLTLNTANSYFTMSFSIQVIE